MKITRKVIKEAQKFVDHGQWNTHEFEIVDNFPAGYQVWNIGRQNFPHPGYIPLCKADSHYNVDLDSLKALKVKDEKTALDILKRAARGTITAKNYLDTFNENTIPSKTFRQYLKEDNDREEEYVLVGYDRGRHEKRFDVLKAKDSVGAKSEARKNIQEYEDWFKKWGWDDEKIVSWELQWQMIDPKNGDIISHNTLARF